VWCPTWCKSWVNSVLFTDNSTDLKTVFSIRLSHRDLRNSLKESHSFLSLPADTMMASSQGTSVSSNSFSRWILHDKFLFKYHFLLLILRLIFFFYITLWPIWLPNSKQQPCFYPPQSLPEKTHRTDKQTDKPDGKTVLCQRTFSSIFCAIFFFFTQLNCTV